MNLYRRACPKKTPTSYGQFLNWPLRSLLLAIMLATQGPSEAATISAASCSSADVQKALNLAKAGDTVLIPPGSCSWTEGVSWTAAPGVTVRGAGTTATGGEDQTVITDNYASGKRLLNIYVSSTSFFRLSGITFRSGTGATKDDGTINIEGPGYVRIDHCRFAATSQANYKMVRFGGGVFGVMDQCILDFKGVNALYFYNGRQGRGDWMGNLEWSLPTDFGGTNYFYIENNIINGDVWGGSYSTRVFDGFTAAKVVVRFNDISQAVLGETHSTGHAPDDRGLRSQEIYCNKVTSSLRCDPNYAAIDMGSGTALVWGNHWNQVYKNIYLFKLTRKNNTTYAQAPTPEGWGYAGTQFNGTGSMWDGGTAQGTDAKLGYPCLDQPGRGPGQLLSGALPKKINVTTGTVFWPNQALEPIYIWNNKGDIVNGWGGAVYNNDTGGRVLPNRDYYPSASGQQTSPTSPFDGKSGTGWGTLANRPATCVPGVAYFATDQGSWNKSTTNAYGVQMNGASGVLYKCTETNTWTLYYTPLTYPHPLTQIESPALDSLPLAPSNLRAIPR